LQLGVGLCTISCQYLGKDAVSIPNALLNLVDYSIPSVIFENMPKLSASFHLYKSYVVPSLLIALLLGFVTQNAIFFILIKLASHPFLIANMNLSQRTNSLCFYQNLGISRLQLLLLLILFDIILLLLITPFLMLLI
jgi:hypothetical protein